MLNEIPLSRPDTPLLDKVDNPDALKLLELDQLAQLAEELRAFLLYSVVRPADISVQDSALSS